MEREIAQLEEKLAQCEEKMTQFGSDPEKLMELTAQQESLNESLMEKMEAWETQSMLLGDG